MSNLGIARVCAALSAIAYSDVSLDDLRLQRLNISWVKVIEVGASYVFLAWDRRRMFVAFRGTDDLKDLFWDLRFIKRDFPGGGRVHRGFFAAYDKVRAPLLDELGGLVTRVPIIVTGHSLGAAMAQMLTAELCSPLLENCSPHPPQEVHLFGSPRAGNKTFVKRITCPVTRYKGRLDPIAWVPLRMGPVQAGAAIRQGRKPTMFRQPGEGKIVPAWFHNMDKYRLSLDRLVAGG